MPKLQDMSEAELEAAIQKLQAQASEANGKQDELREELNVRHAQQKAERILEDLSPGQRDVLIEAAVAQASAEASAPEGAGN